MARALGRTFMPWQNLVVDTALELNAAGHLHYRTVVLIVPRQQGKSFLLQALMVAGALRGDDPTTTIYTAQDRGEARRRLLGELHERTLDRSPLRRKYTVRATNGDESLRFRHGSIITIVAPTATAGHGQTLDLGVIDEAFAQTSMALPQAFGPAMVTRRDAQLWIVSVVGDGTDTMLQHYQELGAASLADPESRIAFFEWSAPDGDPYDEALWWGCMPALGRTIDPDDVRADPTYADPDEFGRAYLCRRPEALPDAAIDLVGWHATTVDRLALVDPVVFAVDVSLDRGHASIAAASPIAGGAIGVEVVRHDAGTSWVVDEVARLAADHGSQRVVLDVRGPAGALLDDLVARRVPIVEADTTDVARACAQLVDAVAARSLRHLEQPPLDDAVLAAARLYVGDAFRWRRRTPLAPVDLSPLYAATLARWGVATAPGVPVVAAR